jgi:type II secretory pathway predicted ATPase ExeA
MLDMCVDNPLRMKSFHVVWARNVQEYSLKLRIGKARIYRLAFVPNPDMTFIQLVKEMIGQLSEEVRVETRRAQFLEVFNQLLFKTRAEGKKILIFIDEANVMKPSTLESLRLLTNAGRR